jgi:hypothetical protein
MSSPNSKTLLPRIRALCLSFADVSERDSHGAPTFFVQEKRSFLNLVESYYGPGGRPAIICAAPEGAQSALVDAEPDLYFLPKYVAKQGWIGMWLDGDAPWAEITSIVTAAHATSAEKLAPGRAPKKATRAKRAR